MWSLSSRTWDGISWRSRTARRIGLYSGTSVDVMPVRLYTIVTEALKDVSFFMDPAIIKVKHNPTLSTTKHVGAHYFTNKAVLYDITVEGLGFAFVYNHNVFRTFKLLKRILTWQDYENWQLSTTCSSCKCKCQRNLNSFSTSRC